MPPRQKTVTETKTRWVDDCTICGREMSARMPTARDYETKKNEPLVCYDCRCKQAVDKLRDELSYLVGATVVEVEVKTDTHYPDPMALRLRCADGRVVTARARSDHDGGGELEIEEGEGE